MIERGAVGVYIRFYRACTWSLPGDVRRSHGPELAETFEAMLDDRRGSSAGSRAGFVARACGEVLREGTAERARRAGDGVRRLFGGRTGPRAHLDGQYTRQGDGSRGAARGGTSPLRTMGRRGDGMGDLWNGLSQAFRGLVRTPVATVTLVATLALGIGANSAVFSVLNAVLLAPLPYPEPEALYSVGHEYTQVDGAGINGIVGPDLLDYIEGAPSFASMGSLNTLETNLTDEQGAARVTIGWVTPDLFPTLGAEAAVGRMLDPSDWTPRTRAQMEDPTFQPPPMPVMLSHSIWRARFGEDPDIVGRSLVINGTSMNVVGVLAPDFRILLPPEAGVPSRIDAFSYLPIPMTEGQRAGNGGWVVGRLAEGASYERAVGELETVNERLHATWPNHERLGTRVVSAPLLDGVVGPSKALLWVLFGAIGLVLLVAVANVANLLLVRAQAREREFAIRAALGVSRKRVVLGLLTESLILGVLGASAGLVLAVAGVEVLVRLAPVDIPRLDSVAVDPGVVGFTALVTLGASLLFGAAPAVQGARVKGSTLVSSRGAMGVGRGGLRLRQALVVSEIGLSVVLLAGAGLLLRSFSELTQVDPGYAPGEALAVEMALPFFTYRDLETRQVFFNELRRQAQEIPGVRQVGLSPGLPMTDGGGTWLAPYALQGEIGAETETRARYRTAGPGYFEALGARLVDGRDFQEFESASGEADSPIPVLVDEQFAREAWPDGDVLGRNLQVAVAAYIGNGRYATGRVVGVVEPIRHQSLSVAEEPTVWIPFDEYAPLEGVLVLRGDFETETAVAGIRGIINRLDPGVPVYDVRSIREDLETATAVQRYALLLLGLFAVTALVLAAVGLYGVISTSVQQRTREIGLRLAVGAEGASVGRMILGQGARVVAVGLVVGMVGSWLAAPVLGSLLFGIGPGDPVTLFVTAVILAGVALLATWLPAARASRMNPVDALRTDG